MSQSTPNLEQLRELQRAALAKREGIHTSSLHQDDLSRVLQAINRVAHALGPLQATSVTGNARVRQIINVAHADTVYATSAESFWDSSPNTSSAAAAGLLEQLSAHTVGDMKRHLEEWKTKLRTGQGKDVAAEIDRLEHQSPRVWDEVFTLDVKADVLIFAAALAIELRGDAVEARKRLERARGYARRDDIKVQALIVRLESGLQAALDFLEAEGRDDGDTTNLRASFLLDLGRSRACLDLLDSSTVEGQDHTEALHLYALAYLLEKRIDSARVAAFAALEQEPQWIVNRFTAALVNYHAALSPAVLPNQLPAWPQPPLLPYIKRDTDSLGYLDKAIGQFRSLMHDVDTDSDVYRSAQVWLLACLANAMDRTEEALAQARALLADDFTAPHGILWIVARNYDLDAKPSICRFKSLVELNQAELPHLLALVVWYSAHDKARKAAALLKRPLVRGLFRERGLESTWTLWYAQTLTATGKETAALQMIDKVSPSSESREARIVALYALAQKRGKWDALFQCLESAYEETGEPAYLYECCEAKMVCGEWAYVAERAKELVAECETEAAVTLAAQALYRTQSFVLCRTLLDKRRGLFAHGRLPPTIMRLKIACLRALSALPEATIEAEALVQEAKTPENVLLLLQTHHAAGNLPALRHWAQSLRPMLNLSATEALRAAALLQHEDKNLSRELWRRAVNSHTLADESVVVAWTLGFNLELDMETERIAQRVSAMDHAARNGIHKMYNMAELLKMLQGQRAHQEEAVRLYLQGTAPVQILPAIARRSLVELYHSDLTQREKAPDPVHQGALFARHGGRPLQAGFAPIAPTSRLHLDITALLLAAHVDLLPLIEQTFRPLYIGGEAIADLMAIRDALTISQPSHERINRLILDLFERQQVIRLPENDLVTMRDANVAQQMGDAWADLYGHAVHSGGYVVEYLPLRRPTQDSMFATVSNAVQSRLVNGRAVIDALYAQNALSPRQYREAMAKLGSEGMRAPVAPSLAIGARLFCQGNTIELLAETGQLELICERFDVRVEQREIEWLRASVAAFEHAHQNIEWLTNLISKLHRGLEDGVYRRIISSSTIVAKSANEGAWQGERSMRALLEVVALPGDMLWADDRFMTSYPQQEGGMPIIGINEVLKALVNVNALAEDDYYLTLSRLRASNVRFIPVEADEILFHLRRAPIDAATGAVVDTQHLRILRRYIAACILQGDVLQKSPALDVVSNKAGEMAFILSLKAAMGNALVGAWQTGVDDAESRARAEWLLRNIDVDLISLRTLVPTGSSDADHSDEGCLAIEAVNLAHLLVNQPMVTGDAAASKEKQDHYTAWLNQYVLNPRFDREPRLVDAIAAHITGSLLEIFGSIDLKAYDPEQLAMSIFVYLDGLPPLLRNAVQSNPVFLDELGIQVRETYNHDGLRFDRNAFYHHAAQAIDGEDVSVKPLNSHSPVTLHRRDAPDGRITICFDNPLTQHESRIDSDELNLLFADVTQRAAWLRAHRDWLDCDDEILNDLAAQVASTSNPADRIALITSWWKTSATLYYRRLEQRRRMGGTIDSADLLRVDANGLRRHLRLLAEVEQVAVPSALDDAARQLIREEGLLAALERFMGLPTGLPTPILSAFDKRDALERRALVKKLLRVSEAPLARIHLLYLLRRCEDSSLAYQRLSSHIARALTGEKGRAASRTFAVLLRWIESEFGRRSETQGWTPAVRLAVVWTHAHRVLTILLAGKVDIAPLYDAIRSIIRNLEDELLQPSRAEWTDIAHPHWIDDYPDTLIFSGLLYASGGNANTLIADLQLDRAAENGDGLAPPSLILDPTRADNVLQSFLADPVIDHIPILKMGNNDETVTRAVLYELVDLSLGRLSEDTNDFEAWGLIGVAVGDMPLAPFIKSWWRDVLLATSFVDLVDRDSTLGMGALRIACIQSRLEDDVRVRLEAQIVDVARHLAEKTMATEDMEDASVPSIGELGLQLLGIAAVLCARSHTVASAVSSFTSLSTRVIEVAAPIAVYYRAPIQALYEQLPASLRCHLASLVVQLRTLP